ncbi:MAG: hypothetical protein NTW96_18060 [Planctomycetia bacterium]|nr:hypothetical protein [Planctomycetia bacterium]
MRRLPPGGLGFGGLTTSLDGGFDDVLESFFNRAISACNRVRSPPNSAIRGTEAGVEPGHVRLVLNSPGARVL